MGFVLIVGDFENLFDATDQLVLGDGAGERSHQLAVSDEEQGRQLVNAEGSSDLGMLLGVDDQVRQPTAESVHHAPDDRRQQMTGATPGRSDLEQDQLELLYVSLI